MRLRSSLRNTSQDPPSWLVLLFLLVGVIAPAASILWFTNRAADSEAASARREVAEAYQGQLRLLRDRVDRQWQVRAEELSRTSFQSIITGKLADSAIQLRPDGSVAYPIPLPPLADLPALPVQAARTFETNGRWRDAADLYGRFAQATQDPNLAARAAQAQIRCLLQVDDRQAALNVIDQFFAKDRPVGSSGHSIRGDELLLAIKLLPPKDKRQRTYSARLTSLLNDYEHNKMPSAQRLFLMGESHGDFPTLAAERLAAQFLEADQPRASRTGLQSTNLPNVWKLLSTDGRVLGLFNTESVMNLTRDVIDETSKDVRFAAVPPGSQSGTDASVTAGAMLPGWQLTFANNDGASAEAEAQRRRNAYLWTGYLVIAAVVLTSLLLGHWFRRQMQLARLKTDLVASVSHELKTPLASMRLLVDALLDDDHVDAAKTRDYLTLIAGENERLTHLIENFLTFSRIERRKLQFSLKSAEPNTVVDSAVAAVQERFEKSGGKVTISVESGLPAIQADADALTTVLVNLLDNAFKYTPSEKRVEVRAYRENGQVVFSVVDNGMGIVPSEQKRIFRKFYRVDQSLAGETSGCGLGLSIVESIVRAHGGEVRVASTLGQGSTFSIILPASV